MPRPIYPRPESQHRLTADRVLAKYSAKSGVPISLPVPIELIIEQSFGLEILWDEIEEPSNVIILGALAPQERRIVLNSRHEELFEQFIGPERFTLAHELAHWIYDADDPDQLTLDFGDQLTVQHCYPMAFNELSDSFRIREINANKLAAHLLLPEELVRSACIDKVIGDIAGTAAEWQVSRTTLRIRLEELGLTGSQATDQLSFP